jgi:hypothetical protein
MRKVIRMSFDTIMQILGVLIIPIVAFIHKETSSTKKELADFKTEVAREYAQKEEIIRVENKLDDIYKLILERLPKKAK